MSNQLLQHLVRLIADEGHACTFQSLGQYRKALLEAVAQADAPEQVPVGYTNEIQLGVIAEGRIGNLYPCEGPGMNPIKLYTHADQSEVAQLRAQSATRQEAAEELARLLKSSGEECRAATQRADAAERKLGEALGLLREMDNYLSRRGDGEAIHTGSKFHMAIEALLSASAEPASHWVKCSDRLPDPEEHMRVFAVSALTDAVTIWATSSLLRNPAGFDMWMPLPAVPAKGGNNSVINNTRSDQYRAELYDEVWAKARGMGFPNVTEALTALAQLQSGEAITLDKDAQSILSQCIGAHAFIVAAITKGRPDAALAEARKWVESFREAAEAMRHQTGSPAGQNMPPQEGDQ